MDPRQKPSEATVLKSLHGSVSGRSLSSHTSVFMVITPYIHMCVCAYIIPVKSLEKILFLMFF